MEFEGRRMSKQLRNIEERKLKTFQICVKKMKNSRKKRWKVNRFRSEKQKIED